MNHNSQAGRQRPTNTLRFSRHGEVYPRFIYVLPIEGDDDDQTMIQAFSRGTYGASMLLRYLKDAPASLFDLIVTDYHGRIELACQGASSYHVIAINTQHLPRLAFDWSASLVVVLSWETSDANVRRWIERCSGTPLHASNSTTGKNVVALDSLNDDALRAFARSSLERLTSDPSVGANALELLNALRHVTSPRVPLEIPQRNHNALVPNEFVLHRAGYSLGPFVRFDPADGDSQVVEAIANTARAILAARAEDLPDLLETPAIILTAPGHSRAMSEAILEGGKRKPPPEQVAVAKSVRQSWAWLKRQAGYFPTFQTSSKDAEYATSPAAQLLLQERSEELFAYTQGLQVRAASEMSAVLRMPGIVHQLRQPLVDLANCHAGRSQRRLEKLATLVARLQDKLRQTVPKELAKVLDRPPCGIRIVADLPFEWFPLDNGQPLMLRHCCSRIPCTPGNVMFQTSLPRPKIELRQSILKKLLVVRSFGADDGLTNALENSIDAYGLREKGLELTIRDVKSKEEFCDALGSFDGAWFVFDGHGTTSKLGSSLVVGGQELDLWELRGKVRCPPIAIPLSCSMHPIDSSHGSAGTALLASGARTSFGSLLRIGGVEAAVFTARLIRAVVELLPRMFDTGMPWISWARLFWMVQQGQFVNELSWLLRRKVPRFDGQIASALTTALLQTIHQHPDWYSDCLAGFARASRMKLAELKRLISRELPLPDCLAYIQLGDPESILITNPAVVDRFLQERREATKAFGAE